MSRFHAPIAEQIWDMKYRLKAADGTALDGSVEDTWRRIARALAEVETDKALWEDRFYHALEDFKFLPAGRITAGAGTGRAQASWRVISDCGRSGGKRFDIGEAFWLIGCRQTAPESENKK